MYMFITQIIQGDFLTCVPWLSIVSGLKCFLAQCWAFVTDTFVCFRIGTVPSEHSMILLLWILDLLLSFGLDIEKDGFSYSKL